MHEDTSQHTGEQLCALLRTLRTQIESTARGERIARTRLFELHHLASMAIELADRVADDRMTAI